MACICPNKYHHPLLKILQDASVDNSYDRDIIKRTLNGMDINEVCVVIESYRNEGTSEYSPELIKWLNQVRDMLKTVNYNVLCHFICKVLGLTGVSHIVIVELLYKTRN